MGRIGCNVDGQLDATNFGTPIPWIGAYIAAASFACLIAMAADAISGIRHRKLWFPCKYFCLNATSLALIAVAVKLSVDLNTPMPHRRDQLAKLSSSALICTITGNSIPSLGAMENKEIFLNVVALGILVVTMIVNICIQLGTGVIYVFQEEHALIMFLMLILFMTMCSSAFTLPKMKHYMELRYKVNKMALKESSNQIGEEANQVINKLRDELTKYWMMAHTSSPQFVIGRSVTCIASGAFSLLSAVTLAEAMLRSHLMPWSFKFCTGDCDYKWSTILILIIQVSAVGVGTIAPAFRWFIAINYRCPNVSSKSCKRTFEVESYWTARLVLMKESPLGLRIHNRRYRKSAHDAKVLFFNLCIHLHKGIVLMSKATQLVSVYLVCWILSCCDYCKKLKPKFENTVPSTSSGTEPKPDSRLDLRRFVLHLEGEEELVEVMMKENRDATSHWLQVGEKMQPEHLIELIEKSSILQGFKGVGAFDSDQVPSLHFKEPPYSWSLPLVTLASIIVALPNINRSSVKKLISTLNEGLLYVKFIENNMDKEGQLIKVGKAAEIVWLGVDLYHKWLDVDLYKLSLQDKSPKEILERLADAAKIKCGKIKAKYIHLCPRLNPSSWPIKVLAANSMYRISQTILFNHKSINEHSSERLFEALTVMISDLLGACLTNLPHVISTKCLNSAIEEREDSVRHAVYILGKTKRIIEMLDKRAFLNLDFSRGSNVEDWRLMHKPSSPFPRVPSSLKNDTHTVYPDLNDVCLNFE